MRLCEIYTSIQGEGPNVGEPTTFVRFGGCNLRCSGWGEGLLPDGTTVPGCDTVFAVYPEWRSSWDALTPQEVADRVPVTPQRICITGGEPLIQPAKDMEELFWELRNRDHVFDLFTNGTRLLPDWATHPSVTVVMDWKLSGSKEADSFNHDNLSRLNPQKDAIKFVCKDRNDFEEALILIREFIGKGVRDGEHGNIYFAPVWGHLEPDVLSAWVAESFPQGKLNIQTHKYIFGDVRGT